MFVSPRMQFHKHVDTTSETFRKAMRCIYAGPD